MKLSDYKGEKAIEKFADLIEPVCKILGDKEIKSGILAEEPKALLVKKALKNHASEVLEVLAILDDVPVDGYEPSIVEIPVKVLELLNDDAFGKLFTSQSQTNEDPSSGSATENTQGSEN